MVLVKLTALLIVLTVIFRFIVLTLFNREDGVTKYQIVRGIKAPWYMIICSIMLILTFVGVIYSAVYLLFLR